MSDLFDVPYRSAVGDKAVVLSEILYPGLERLKPYIKISHP
jgi:hypothetical protein